MVLDYRYRPFDACQVFQIYLGLPVYVLFDHSQSALLPLQISEVGLLDADTGKQILSSTPQPYNNSNANYRFIIGPIAPPCTYFEIEVSKIFQSYNHTTSIMYKWLYGSGLSNEPKRTKIRSRNLDVRDYGEIFIFS